MALYFVVCDDIEKPLGMLALRKCQPCSALAEYNLEFQVSILNRQKRELYEVFPRNALK